MKQHPAEGTSYSLAKLDKALFPDIICANEEEYIHGHEPFYSNSSHLPVQYTDDVFEALDHQDELQSLYTGGTVLHGFIGERINDTQGLKQSDPHHLQPIPPAVFYDHPYLQYLSQLWLFSR